MAKKMTKASPVKVTKADGTVEMRPAYSRYKLRKVLGAYDKRTRRMMQKGEM